MKKNRIKIYGILLPAMMTACMAVLATGSSRARYNNTITASAFWYTESNQLTSNCLVNAKDSPCTVLLGKLEEGETLKVPFWIESPETGQSANLSFGILDPEYEDYIEVSVTDGQKALQNAEGLELLKEERVHLTLCLGLKETDRANEEKSETEADAVTGKAVNTESNAVTGRTVNTENSAAAGEIIKTKIYVALGEEMYGIFQVSFSLEKNLTEPEEPQPDEGGFEDNWEGSVSSGDAMDSVSGGDAPEAVSDGDAPSTIAVMDPLEAVSDGDATGEEEMPEGSGSRLDTIEAFDLTQQLPVGIGLQEKVTSFRLGMQKPDETENTPDEKKSIEALPDYTRISLDGGLHYYMVYGQLIPEFQTEETADVPLLLDFKYTDLKPDEKITLAMETYVGDKLQETCFAGSLAGVDSGNRLMASTIGEGTQPSYGNVLSFENTLELPLPAEWKDAEMAYTVEHLTMTEEGKPEYVPAQLAEDKLEVISVTEGENHRLVLKLGKKFTQPGTYRIHIYWNYDSLCYNIIKKTFFINCPQQGATGMGRMEASNDE